MIRFFASTVLQVLSNAVGLLVASILLDGFTINGAAFIIALLIFSVSQIILGPFIMKVALRNAPYLMGGIALVTIFVSLIITRVLSDGILISGVTTWVTATFIIWLFTVLAGIILPLFIFKRTVQSIKDSKGDNV